MKNINMKHNIKHCDFKINFMTIKVGITENKNTIEKHNIKHSIRHHPGWKLDLANVDS
jgi:hypothetical protein